MDAKKLIETIRDMDLHCSVRSYSGRGMYGRQCVGVVIDGMSLFTFGIEVAREWLNRSDDPCEIEDLADLEAREDSMGLGTIIYFPKLKWPEGMDSDAGEADHVKRRGWPPE